MSEQKDRKIVIGKVTSDKMMKSIKVIRESKKMHERYKKYVPTRTSYMAHDENNQAKIGDLVQISFTRPLSKNKCWKLDRVLQVAERVGS